jgi:dTMP kinase
MVGVVTKTVVSESRHPVMPSTLLPVAAVPHRPLFITLEGIDGCGKSTQAKALAQLLAQQGYSVCLTKNPGDTPLGQELRQVLLHSASPIHPKAELLLYMADRVQHWFDLVLPSLQAGQIVICDRFVDSTLVYQGYGRGESLDWILALHDQALQTAVRPYWPDVTFWFNAPVDTCLNRVQARATAKGYDRLETMPTEFYQTLHQGFTQLAAQHASRYTPIDATQPIADITQQLVAAIVQRVAV